MPTVTTLAQRSASDNSTIGNSTIENNVELLHRYTDQPARLPDDVRRLVALATGQTQIDAYALIDLDGDLSLCQRWLVLTPDGVVLHVPGQPALAAPRSAVERCSLERGLSCNTLRIQLRGGEPGG
jgi:hypothetical protein